MTMHKPASLTFALMMLPVALVSSQAWALKQPGGEAEAWTILEIKKETAKVGSSITTFGSTFGAASQAKFELLLSAISVATKQEALSANLIAESKRASGNAAILASKAQSSTRQIGETYLRYSPRTGQGFDPCGTLVKNKSLDKVFDGLHRRASSGMGTPTSAPGRLVSSTSAAMQERLKRHRDNFCTKSEADAGLCRLSNMPGADTNAGLLFDSVAPNSKEAAARTAFIDHVLGEPDQAVNKSAGQSAAGRVYLLAKNRKDSLLSIPAYSFAMINEANLQSADMGGKTANEALRLRVNQYFGGNEAKDWTTRMVEQDTRGLLVEGAKMAGLEVWLRHKQYQQNQRMEANLAALVLANGDRFSAPLSGLYRQAMTDALRVQVK